MSDVARDYLSHYRALSPRLPGAQDDWLTGLRQSGARQLERAGLPGAPWEQWKYTSLRALERRSFEPALAPAPVTARDVEASTFALGGHRLVFVNGCFAPTLSGGLDRLPGGARVSALAEAWGRDRALLQSHLGQIAPNDFNGFSAMNTAFLADGALVHLASGTVLEEPVHLLFLSTPEAKAVVSNPRVLVVAEANSQATVVEHYAALGAAGNFTNAVSELVLGQGARIAHYKIQEESRTGLHVAGIHARQARDSQLVSHNVNLGGQWVRNDLRVCLEGQGAETVLNGLYVVDARQHVDNHTTIEHVAPHTRSEEDYKGVVTGAGRAVFNGKVVVHRDAQKIEAHQSNPNLLLSAKGEVDTKPELQIFADDVKCSHGATVGQLDAQALFYLRSRGLDEATAIGVLTFGFAEAAIARLGFRAMRSHLEQLLIERLPAAQAVAKEMTSG